MMNNMIFVDPDFNEGSIPTIKVPYLDEMGNAIKYLSQWKEYKLPLGHCIIDKTVCGCGFTQYCIENEDNLIIVSPRKTLIINKVEQNPNCYYFKAETLTLLERRTLVKMHPLEDPEELFRQECFKKQYNNLKDYLQGDVFPKKIMVTNDSLPKLSLILDILSDNNLLSFELSSLKIIVDEFQLIFSDAKFKASAELNLVSNLQKFPNVVYVSATPVMKKYLNEIPEFKNLPYQRLDWGNRSIKPKIEKVHTSNLLQLALEEIRVYKEGIFNYSAINSYGELITSKELVFYVSNISMITSTIKKSKLTPDEVNIIVSETPENKKKIQQLGKGFKIGKAPLKGQPHKMFTFCTSTAYCGVDFYSTNARTIILSNCNLSSMAIDISLDLPQILGRQRLIDKNPFALEALFVYTTTIKNIAEKDFENYVEQKIYQTDTLVENYLISSEKFKPVLREKVRVSIDAEKYERDYAGIDGYSGDVVFNRLVLLAEIRAWEVQNRNYETDFNVMSTISSEDRIELAPITNFLDREYYNILSISTWEGKMRECCELYRIDPNHPVLLKLPSEYKYYLDIFGISGISRNSYKKANLEKERKNLTKEISTDETDSIIISELKKSFNIGDKITLKKLKEWFRNLKDIHSLPIVPKAGLIKNYCDVKRAQITSITGGGREEGFEILSFLN